MESYVAELLSQLPKEVIEHYKSLAYDYLERNDFILEVMFAGGDEDIQDIHGICLRKEDGYEEWYDSQENNSGTLLGWSEEVEAQTFLDNEVLPNLGYLVHLREFQLFHTYMTNV